MTEVLQSLRRELRDGGGKFSRLVREPLRCRGGWDALRGLGGNSKRVLWKNSEGVIGFPSWMVLKSGGCCLTPEGGEGKHGIVMSLKKSRGRSNV